MTTQANPTYYSGVDRAERRRIAKEIDRVAELKHRAELDAIRIREQKKRLENQAAAAQRRADRDFLFPNKAAVHLGVAAVKRAEAAQLEALAANIVGAVMVPTRLLACVDCHRPPMSCTCVDAEGNPLKWD